jgi:hypothetical protein
MKVVISRTYDKDETRGSLFILEGELKHFECKTLELPYKGNQKNISCISEGVYDVEKVVSLTKGKCFLLKDVQNRTAVMIHTGNFAAGKQIDTQGCILPGMSFVDKNGDGVLDVSDSTVAMTSLLKILPDKFELYII